MRFFSAISDVFELGMERALQKPMFRYHYKLLLFRLSPVLLANHRYRTKLGRLPNLKNPARFDEKLLWLMLYWRHPLKTQCGDKYTMRAYVEQHGWGHLLTKLFGVYEDSREIDFAALPERFVLKCTHGCKFNIICRNREELDLDEVRRTLDRWMATDISVRTGELHYAPMKHRIICEEFLDDRTGELPVDYKVYCFGGKAHATLVLQKRNMPGGPVLDCYDRDWKTAHHYHPDDLSSNQFVPRPEGYEEMIAAAEALSKPFPFVRMDFYSIQGRVVLGEMTFTPAACINRDWTEQAQQELGDLIQLPSRFPAVRTGSWFCRNRWKHDAKI